MGETTVEVRFGDEKIWELLHGPCPLVAGDPGQHPGWDGEAPQVLWTDPADPQVWVGWTPERRLISPAAMDVWLPFCRGEPVTWPAVCAALTLVNVTSDLPQNPPGSALLALRGVAGLLAPYRAGPFSALSPDAAGPSPQVLKSPASRVWLCHHPDPWVRARAARACADAGSDAGVLLYLAADQDARVRAAVAGNSHTAREVLTEMAEDADADVRRALAGNVATPATLLGALVVGSTSTARIVVYRKDTPPEVLLTLTEHADGDIRALAVSRTPLDTLLAHQFARPESRGEVWVALARNPDTPTEVLGELLDQILAEPVGACVDLDDWRVALRIAEHPNATTAQLQRLVDRPHDDGSANLLETHLAENPHTPAGVLHRLAQSDDGRVRTAARTTLHALRAAPAEYLAAFAARHRGQPGALRQFAARHPMPSEDPEEVLAAAADVRAWAAAQLRSPEHLLATLARDRDRNVRMSLAYNVAAPPHALHILTVDPDEEIRKTVVANPNTAETDLIEMARTDGSLDVVAAIRNWRKVPPGHDLEAALTERAAQYPPCYLARWACPPVGPPSADVADHQELANPRRSFTERLAAARRSQQTSRRIGWCRSQHYTTCLVPVFSELLASTTRPAVVQGVLDAVREEIDETSWIRAMGQWCDNPTAGESLGQLDQAAGRNSTLDMAALWHRPSHTLWHETQKVLHGAMRACPRCGE